MAAIRSAIACLHFAASGAPARSASSARSIALSTVCQSAAARGFNPASASSHLVSRSLIRVLAAGRSPLSISAATSTTMLRNGVRSPSFAVAASANGTKVKCWVACMRGSPVKVVSRQTATAEISFIMWFLLVELLLHAESGISRLLLRRIGAAPAVALEGHPSDEADDHGQEGDAGLDRAEADAAVLARLRQQIAERGAKRTGQDVGKP